MYFQEIGIAAIKTSLKIYSEAIVPIFFGTVILNLWAVYDAGEVATDYSYLLSCFLISS